jgi:hypothetical protein
MLPTFLLIGAMKSGTTALYTVDRSESEEDRCLEPLIGRDLSPWLRTDAEAVR